MSFIDLYEEKESLPCNLFTLLLELKKHFLYKRQNLGSTGVLSVQRKTLNYLTILRKI